MTIDLSNPEYTRWRIIAELQKRELINRLEARSVYYIPMPQFIIWAREKGKGSLEFIGG